MDAAEFKARIEQIFRDLEQYNYYDLLNLQPGASADEIRQAFHRMALSMHPDRYQQSPDKELRDQLYVVYKRVCEGYRVLGDVKTRDAYLAGLEKGEKRLVRKERAKAGPQRIDKGIRNLKAKKFFEMGRDAERRGDFKNAKLNYQFAIGLEENPIIAQQIAIVDEAAAKAAAQDKADSAKKE